MIQVRKLLTALLLFLPFTANAGLVTEVELIDDNNFSLSMSGTLDGPRPGGDSWLFIALNPSADVVTCGTNTCSASFVSGNLQKTSNNTPNAVWVADYIGGPHIQIAWSPLNVGDVFSGTSTFSVATGHGMTVGDFAGADVYWGYGPEITNGLYQGIATASSSGGTVPVPAPLALLGLGLIGIASTRKR